MARNSPRHRNRTATTWAALLAATGLALVGCGSDGGTAPDGTGTDAGPLTPGPPPPPGATGAPAIGISTLPPVPVGEPAAFADVKLAANVTKIDQVQLGANGPGEIAGPGVAATVEFRNESDRDIDLGGVTVNAYYGDRLPASPSDAAPAGPVSGPLAPQQSKSGVYVFQVPAEQASKLSVEVNYSGSADVVVVNR